MEMRDTMITGQDGRTAGTGVTPWRAARRGMPEHAAETGELQRAGDIACRTWAAVETRSPIANGLLDSNPIRIILARPCSVNLRAHRPEMVLIDGVGMPPVNHSTQWRKCGLIADTIASWSKGQSRKAETVATVLAESSRRSSYEILICSI